MAFFTLFLPQMLALILRRSAELDFERFSPAVADLLPRMLRMHPAERIGSAELKAHVWFAHLEWASLLDQQPPFEPELKDSGELTYFPSGGTSIGSKDSKDDVATDVVQALLDSANKRSGSRGSLARLDDSPNASSLDSTSLGGSRSSFSSSMCSQSVEQLVGMSMNTASSSSIGGHPSSIDVSSAQSSIDRGRYDDLSP